MQHSTNKLRALSETAILLLGIGLYGCKSTGNQDSHSKAVIDNDDRTLVKFNDGPYVAAMGLVEFALNGSGRICTGTHVGKGIVLTAGHCLVGEGDVTTSSARKTCNDDKGQYKMLGVAWGVSPEHHDGYLYSKCKEVLTISKMENFTYGDDYALIKVDPAPTQVIALNMQPVPENTSVRAFGNPLDKAQDGLTGIWRTPECKTLAHKQGEGGEADLYFKCDTSGGMSGGPLMNAKNEMIGIILGSTQTSSHGLVNYARPLSQIPELKALLGKTR